MTNNTHYISLSPDAILSRLYDSIHDVSTNIACYSRIPFLISLVPANS